MTLRTKKTIILFSSLLLVASVQGAAFAAKASSAKANPCKDVGPVDLNAYCQKKIPGSKPELKDKTAQGWQCAAPKGTAAAGAAAGAVNTKFVKVDMKAACKQQYGDKVKAQALNPKDPNSWRCMECPSK